LAVVPLLGGYCVLARQPDALGGLGGPCRLVDARSLRAAAAGMEPSFRDRVLGVMSAPLIGRFAFGRSGLALASEPIAAEILRRIDGDVWFGVPRASAEPGQLADELGRRASIVVTGAAAGPGPTSLDFASRPVVIDRRGKLGILDVEQQLGELVSMGPGLVFSVLVVCTGNSCRSPMAHYLLSSMLEGTPALICSAGTDAPVGSPAAANAVVVMHEVGIDLVRHRARQLTSAMVEAADLVLVMEEYHRRRVVESVPDAAGRTRLLLSYVGKDERVDDPIGFTAECYRATRDVMRPALARVAAEVRQRSGGSVAPEPTK